jgi:hypothetical protein
LRKKKRKEETKKMQTLDTLLSLLLSRLYIYIHPLRHLSSNDHRHSITPHRPRLGRLIPIHAGDTRRRELDISITISNLTVERRRGHGVARHAVEDVECYGGGAAGGGDGDGLRGDFEEGVGVEGVIGPEEGLCGGVFGFAAAGGGELVVFEDAPVVLLVNGMLRLQRGVSDGG